jgi:alcohol dehydrogenase YqhD (iron-dependent ADH family)
VMLPYFEWQNPVKVVFGSGVLNKVGKNVKEFGKKCFLVTGRSSAEKQGYLKIVTDQLSEAGIEYVHFNKISPNPKTTEIAEAVEIVRQEKCEFVLALGGGSVMDASKAIVMMAINEGEIWEYIYKGPGSKFKHFNKALPIVMVPTLAATGSELNCGAVISNPETNEKAPFFGEAVYPKLSIIDPDTTKSLPMETTVDGAVDIICHVLEMYLSNAEDDYLQNQLSIAIVKTVKRSLDILKTDPENMEARAQMFWSSSLALSGITTSGAHGVFPMHEIEHVLSGHNTNLAHGRGLATIFLKKLEYDKEAISEKLVHLAKMVFEEDCQNADKGISKWVNWFKVHNTGGSLKEYIGAENIEKLAEQILRFSGTPDFLPNVKPFKKDDLSIFLQKLL